MEKINNLFFCYTILCIGFGVGNIYWNENYTNYIFVGTSSLIGLFIFFSKDFYTKEAHHFFWKQTFLLLLLSVLCMFVQSDKDAYKIIDLAISKMLLGAFIFWAFSIGYRSGGNNRKQKDNEEENDEEKNDMLGTGRYPKPT